MKVYQFLDMCKNLTDDSMIQILSLGGSGDPNASFFMVETEYGDLKCYSGIMNKEVRHFYFNTNEDGELLTVWID